MRLLIFFLFIVECWCNINVLIDGKGGFNVIVGDKVWLRSARIGLYADDQWYSPDNNTLTLVGTTTAEGIDPLLGAWKETQLIYHLDRLGKVTNVVARIRQWSIISAFTFHLDVGEQDLTDRIALDFEEVRTIFPSFYIEQIDENDKRGYFTFSGFMSGSADRHAGSWSSDSTVVTSGFQGGPIVLFNQTQSGEGDVLVLSPFSHFMATSLTQKHNMLQYGVVGSMSLIPANYSQSMIVFYSPRGINAGVYEWGQTMQRAFNRTTVNRMSDITVNYLGYYTDNGGYYYYNTEKNVNYETTILDVNHQIALPFHYLQLDSWWYYKGIGDGVSDWSARPDVFPDGLLSLYRRLENVSLAAHNRYWAFDTVYKNKYSFAVDVGNGKALPIGNDSFWMDLLTEAHNWGLVLYEQDWLNVQTMQFRPTRTDIHLGRQWLTSMGEAADKVGINIQYCMSLPRHILQSLQIPRVTHARVSDDYAVHLRDSTKSTWNIGTASLFADAVGIAPFKDVFWSTSNQPNSPYHSSAKESLPDREILIATLSTGPVGPGDGIPYVNVTRIMKCCRKDGLILKPDRPLTTINAILSDWAEDNGQIPGELYSTWTIIDEREFNIIFASSMKQDYLIYPSMIGGENGVIWSYDNPNNVVVFDDSHPLDVQAATCGDQTFCLWYVSPLWQFADPIRTKYALLGEINKWTAVSRKRFGTFSTNPGKTQTTVVVQGVPMENVSIAVYLSSIKTTFVNCQMSSTTGQATLVINTNSVTCN